MGTLQPKKRLIVCCDGTWNDSISTNNPLTNVSRFARCVDGVAKKDGALQIVYYHTGVGRGTSFAANRVDGATGRGISSNIRNAYSFICHNYNFPPDGIDKDNKEVDDKMDEIFLVGFSRGAFTVRCLAQLINDIGLLTKAGLSHLYSLFRWWKQQWTKPEAQTSLSSSLTKLEERGLVKRKVKIEACAVWDTVSALGFPFPLFIPQPKSSKYAFVNSAVPENVTNAFQALALNEERKHFKPVLWANPPESIKKFKQCWFLGSHADVGGGVEDPTLTNVSLIWMFAQLEMSTKLSLSHETLFQLMIPGARLESDYTIEHTSKVSKPFTVSEGIELRVEYTRTVKTSKGEQNPALKKLAGKVSNSLRGIYVFGGVNPRTPGIPRWLKVQQNQFMAVPAYNVTHYKISDNDQIEAMQVPRTRIEREKGRGKHYTLGENTKEYVHFTVRAILAKGYASCPALKATRTVPTKLEPTKLDDPIVLWDLRKARMPKTSKSDSKKLSPWMSKTIPEDFASDKELELLNSWLEKWKEALSDSSTTKASANAVSTTANVASAMANIHYGTEGVPIQVSGAFSRQNETRETREMKDMRETVSGTLQDTALLFPSRLIQYLTQAREPTLMYPVKEEEEDAV